MPKKYDIIWSATAEQDLKSIVEYIAKDSPDNALNVLIKIEDKCNSLYMLPERGRVVPEFKQFNVVHYHEIIVDNWRIVYKLASQRVYVLSVIDGRRNVEDILLDRLIRND